MATAGRSKIIREMPTQYAANKEVGNQVALGVLDTIDSTLNRMSKEKSLYDGALARELKEIRKQFEGKFFRAVEPADALIFGKGKKELVPAFDSNADLMEGTLGTWRAIFDLKKIVTVFFAGILFSSVAQEGENLVPNGSFEKIG
jgi:hypothetical protein